MNGGAVKPVLTDLSNAERVLATLTEHGPQTCEQLYAALRIDWAELCVALDRLARNGQIMAWRSEDSRDTIIGRTADEEGRLPMHEDR
jgi:hypothetical protein